MSSFKVLIIGAGLGGLTLAHALRRDGIHYKLYERDKGPFDRPQGYRLHLDLDAINALREVLSPDLLQVFDATSYRTQPYTTILGMDLSVIKRLPTDDGDGKGAWPAHEGPPEHANVDRATLRQLLLAGHGDRIHFDKTLARYEVTPHGVVAHFADGTRAEGDVLVGADGIRSAVRHQRAPDCGTVDAGITAIYGRLPVEAAVALAPPETLQDIFTIASDSRKVFLGLGAVLFPTPPEQALQVFAPSIAQRPQDDYVVCIVGGRHEHFPPGLKQCSGAELQEIAATMIADWPGRGADLIRAGDAAAFFLVEMYTSVPCRLPDPDRVTLLGDAIHAMTPTLGRGANLAMRDGALLGRALRSGASGKLPIAEALANFEGPMLDYGFVVVREAAELGQQRMNQNPLPTS